MVSLIGMVVCLSLVVITGFVGQVSLAQVTLAGVSGFTVSHLIVQAGIGFPWGPILGTLAAAVLGLIVGVSALRVRGVSLAVVTLAGVVAIEQFGFANSTWGAGSRGSPVKQPKLAGHRPRIQRRVPRPRRQGAQPGPRVPLPRRCRVLCLLVANLRRSTLGQQMLAVRSNERSAAAAGVNVTRVKLTAYVISSVIAGTAGWMYAYNFGSVSAARFGILIALGFVAFGYIGGITMVSGAIIGGLFATEGLVPHFFQEELRHLRQLDPADRWPLLIFTLIKNPEGVAGTTYRKRQQEEGARAPRAAAMRPRTAGVGELHGSVVAAEP